MGYNDVDMDVVYVGHVARAEVLAALGLLRRHIDPTAPKIDGEAFNITDDEPAPPWTFFRKYWILAGDKTSLSSVWMIPPFIVMLMAHIAEVSDSRPSSILKVSLSRSSSALLLNHQWGF
jgi:sterol-4alpha-carboxylate 3-dehydrogenase (decarboxylating)